MEAQKLGGFDMLILASSWIFWVASVELPTNMFYDKILLSTLERYDFGER